MKAHYKFGLLAASIFGFLLTLGWYQQANAQTYNRFGPANGILVGNTSTPQTTAATSSNVISLWSGTCSASTFLRGDGSCQVATGGSGTVTSVGLTVPAGLSVTGSPITTSGTLAISTSLNGLLRGTGSGFSTAASSHVISLWSGTCDSTTFLRGDGSCVAPGGGGGGGTVTSVDLVMPTGFTVSGNPVTTSGALTVSTALNGVLRGTGTGFATAGSSNIIGLWSGTCSASTFLRGDGSCVNPTTSPAGSNQQIQFNNSGAFGADADFAWNSTSNLLSITGGITASGTISAATLTGNIDATSIASGTLPVARGGTGTTTSTGTGSVVLSGSPTLSGTITGGTFSGTFSGNGASITSLNAANISSGTLPASRGGTGTTTSTGTGSVVLSNSPTLTGTVSADTVAAATNITVAGQNVCRQNGTNCPAAGGGVNAYGVITVSGSTCSLSGTFESAGISSCTYSAAGSYIVNLTSGSGAFPTCVVNALANNPRAPAVSASVNTVTVQLWFYNGSSWATADSNFSLHCVNN